MHEAAWIDEDGLPFIPSNVSEEARIVIGNMGGVPFFDQPFDRVDVGLKLRKGQRLDPFLKDEVDGREIDGVFDVQPVDQADLERRFVGL